MDNEVVRSGFEQKYLVPESEADALLTAVRRLLPPDPMAGPDGTYGVASLYLDTPDWAAYRREVLGKWRLRRYGVNDLIFAEFKAKPEPGKVHKRRVSLDLPACEALPSGKPNWFLRAIQKQDLRPTRLISYQRHAFVGDVEGHAIRLTLDRDVRAAARHDYEIPGPAADGIALTPHRILEIKFETELPVALRQLTAELGLMPESFSKYRTAVEQLQA